MGFYEQISRYYDSIFPVEAAPLAFIEGSAGRPPKRLLDVACGTGGYSAALAGAGYSMVSVDLNEKMVGLAAQKASERGLDMEVLRCDMLKIAEAVPGSFQCVFCIGNSLAHLRSVAEIGNALLQMHSKLSAGGSLALQIINFDRILKYGISRLPEITVGETGLKFIRDYKMDTSSGKIHFDTALTIGKGEKSERYENSIELLPVKSAELIGEIRKAGFGRVDAFGDFSRGVYSEDSFMLVLEAAV